MADPITVIKLGSQFYSSVSLKFVLSQINERINNLYDNIISAHLKSANEAIHAVPTSINPDCELLNALSNIRVAINLLYSKIEERKHQWFAQRYVMNIHARRDNYKKLSELYHIQCILYSLSNLDLAKIQEMKNSHLKSLTQYAELSAKIQIDKGYEYVETVEKWGIGNFANERYFEEVRSYGSYSDEEKKSIRSIYSKEVLSLQEKLNNDLQSLQNLSTN